jgi:hypothetical protein
MIYNRMSVIEIAGRNRIDFEKWIDELGMAGGYRGKKNADRDDYRFHVDPFQSEYGESLTQEEEPSVRAREDRL